MTGIAQGVRMPPAEPWAHDPPCPRGGYTQVSASVAGEPGERCPLCGAGLTAPQAVREARERVAATDRRLSAAWRPRSPREILAMAQEVDG